MGVSAAVMVRNTFVGGLATLSCSLMLWASTQPLHHHRRFLPPLSPVQLSLPDALAAKTLPLPGPIAIALNKPLPAKPQIRDLAYQMARYHGTIRSSLFETAMAQGVPIAQLTEMIRVFSYDVDFQRDIQPGDQFAMLVEPSGDRKIPGRLLYASMTLSGKPLTYYLYVDQQGVADYYTRDGESVKKALLKTPVDGAKISSGFGRRFHPILRYTTAHKGIDFAVMSGTPVMAAGSGVVDYAGPNGAYGLYLRIRHDPTHATAYAHLSRLAAGIRPGRPVEQGQTIGLSGSTGRSTGPHLHYEMLVNDAQVNPMTVKFQSGRKLAGRELSRFQATERQISGFLSQTPVFER